MSTLDPNNHGERIATLEAGQRAMQDTVRKLADVVSEQAENSAREHAATRKDISNLADKLGHFGKPNYGVVISACSFLGMLVAAVLSPFYMQLQENKNSLAKLYDAHHAHTALPIHPVAAAIMAEREKAHNKEMEMRDKLYQAQLDKLWLQIKADQSK